MVGLESKVNPHLSSKSKDNKKVLPDEENMIKEDKNKEKAKRENI